MWGCLAEVAVPTPKRVRIGPKIVDCIFIGYAQNSSAYRFLVHKSDISDIHKNTIMESRSASLFEDVFLCRPQDRVLSSMKEIDDHEDDHIDDHMDDQTADQITDCNSARVGPRATVRTRFVSRFLI